MDTNDMAATRGNLLAILYGFAEYDPVLKEHLEHGQRSAKMISWDIQNEIIACIAEFILEKMKDCLNEGFLTTLLLETKSQTFMQTKKF